MKEIHWKSLSLSLILSTIVNGTALSILIIQYMNAVSSSFRGLLPYINNTTTNNSKGAFTIVEGTSIPIWIWILVLSMSYIVITMISYLLIEYYTRRKK